MRTLKKYGLSSILLAFVLLCNESTKALIIQLQR